MKYNHEGIVIRPPSEANSFLLQVTLGCSHNRCAFCSTYKFIKFQQRPFEKVEEDIKLAARWNPSITKVFMCDGDAMCLPTPDLVQVLDSLNAHFPNLERVGVYANAQNILAKSEDELRLLSSRKLTIGYLGLESGNDEILEQMYKGSTSDEMVEAVVKAQSSGIDMSVIVLLGLGSNEMSEAHATDSGKVASRMNPRYLSALTLMIVPATILHRRYTNGEFDVMTPLGILKELQIFIQNLELEGPCLFRTNHASNYLPLGGVLPDDKESMLQTIKRGLSDSSILRPEHFRAL